MVAASDLTFAHHGAARYDRAALSILGALRAFADGQPADRAGTRLCGDSRLAALLGEEGRVAALAKSLIGANARPVRAILFDKTPAANWSLAWHQDRTIAVRERIAVAGFGPWTMKTGMPHVAPPPALQAGMATLRVHLDDVPTTNAPLLIAPGSHLLGRIAESDVAGVVERCGVVICTAMAGASGRTLRRSSMLPSARSHRYGGAFCKWILVPKICRAACNGLGFDAMIRLLLVTGRGPDVVVPDDTSRFEKRATA